MQKVNQRIRLLFSFALLLSIGLPLGILGIIFGAINGWIAMLILGILLVVSGFYIMPILWVKYAERRGDRVLMFMIEYEHIYTVEGLSTQTGFPAPDVRQRLQRLILSHALVGYLFREDTLEYNTNVKQSKKTRKTKKCRHCGAVMFYDGMKYQCDYCRQTESES